MIIKLWKRFKLFDTNEPDHTSLIKKKPYKRVWFFLSVFKNEGTKVFQYAEYLRALIPENLFHAAKSVGLPTMRRREIHFASSGMIQTSIWNSAIYSETVITCCFLEICSSS